MPYYPSTKTKFCFSRSSLRGRYAVLLRTRGRFNM